MSASKKINLIKNDLDEFIEEYIYLFYCLYKASITTHSKYSFLVVKPNIWVSLLCILVLKISTIMKKTREYFKNTLSYLIQCNCVCVYSMLVFEQKKNKIKNLPITVLKNENSLVIAKFSEEIKSTLIVGYDCEIKNQEE